MDAVALVQEWVRTIGSQAGLTPSNTAINSGSVGVPESRLELEVEFDSLAQLEDFWASIPPDLHRQWSARVQSMIVDGSPQWEIYRTVPAFLSPSIGTSTSTATSTGNKLVFVTNEEEMKTYGASNEPSLPAISEETPSGLAIVRDVGGSSDGGGAAGGGEDVILDWKGEPMKINPGDKLPFRF